jgi:tRNA threonylcarbamoyladenosine biosynthesis protein TsaB
MPCPVILAIETSQRHGGVAVRDRTGQVYIERLGKGGADTATPTATDELMPAIDAVVKRARLLPTDVQVVGVSVGPGGFTGLRIAVATAKALGLILEAKLVAVPSALVAAEGSDIPKSISSGNNILVALACKRNTYWKTVVYMDEEHGWSITGKPGLTNTAERTDAVEAILADRYFPDEARSQYDKLGIPIIEPRFDPAACLRVADRLYSSGEVVDPFAIQPIYPRPPEAVAIWQQRRADQRRVQ